MTGQASTQRGALVIGIGLILLGVAALAVQAGGLRVGWPVWIMGPGLALMFGAFAIGGSGGSGMAAVGGIVTMVGVVLAVQDAYGLYQTWSYAWALVAPGGVGLGLTIYGFLTRRWEDARGGLGALIAGVVIFLVGFLFFEGVIHLSGDRFDDLTTIGVPVLLVAIGAIVLVAAFLPGPWRRPYVVFHDDRDRAAAERGDGGSGWAAPTPDRLGIGLEGAPDAEVMVTFGAGRLAIGPAAAGMLVDGTYEGGVKVEKAGPGRVRLSPPAPANLRWDRAPYAWRVGLTTEIPIRLRVESGAADGELDLSGLRVAELRLRTGASETRVTLPQAAGFTRVDAEGGAAAIRFRVPDGVAARIRSAMALGSSEVDTARFPRNAAGDGWESPDFAGAANRVEIEFRGGMGALSVR